MCIENERQRQTYYGALDVVKGPFLMQSYPKANSQHTVDFIRYIQQRRPGPQVLIFWDGIWLKGKTFVRTHELWTTSFEQIKDLFVEGIRQKKYFHFPKLQQYITSLK